MGTVLIVDDEPAIGSYLARLITGLGHEAVTSLSAVEALEKIGGSSFQLIIADIWLPDAPEPREWIRQLRERAGDCPIVLISGIPSQELTDLATANGVLTFLTKPFELAFIRNVLRSVFEK